jgi:hypothetical protein
LVQSCRSPIAFRKRIVAGCHAFSALSATRKWYVRLYRLLPDIHFDLGRIVVSGAPWNTLIIVEWKETNSGTDGDDAMGDSNRKLLHCRT